MSTAQPIEVKKDGLLQKQDGCWKLTLVVHMNDMPASLMAAPMGTRYGMALVEIGDDEQPVSQPVSPETKSRKPAQRSRSQMAAIRCGDAEFRLWLFEGVPGHTEESAVRRLRNYLDIESRKELDTSPAKAKLWDAMDMQFQQATGRMAERIGG